MYYAVLIINIIYWLFCLDIVHSIGMIGCVTSVFPRGALTESSNNRVGINRQQYKLTNHAEQSKCFTFDCLVCGVGWKEMDCDQKTHIVWSLVIMHVKISDNIYQIIDIVYTMQALI